MANRSFHRVQSLARESKVLYAKATMSSNVATKVVNDSVGVASVVVSGTGTVTVTLDDKYNAFLSASIQSVGSATVDHKFVITSEDVDGAKTVVFKNVEGAVEAAIDDCTIHIKIEVKNSSVAR